MSDLLKWSPFATTRWTSPFSTLMRSPSELMDSLDSLFDAQSGPAPIRIEEFVDGKNLVVRAEMPGVHPGKDVEVTPLPEDAAGPAARKKLPITRA